MKLPPFLNAARSRWRILAPAHHQVGEEVLALVAEVYAQTPAYNHHLQLDELWARIRQLETDLLAERTAALKFGRQLDQYRAAPPLKTRLEQVRTEEKHRLNRWLALSAQETSFSHQRLHALQVEFHRRLAHLERTEKL